MANLGTSAEILIEIAGKNINPPLEWFDVGILATFDSQSQANITTDKFTFVLEAYTAIKDHIAGGLNGSTVGIFEGIPFSMTAYNNTNQYLAFDGFIDLYNEASINDVTGRIEASIKKISGLNTFADQLEALDYGYLKDIGVYTANDYQDIDYVVQKIDASFEALVTAITIYLMAKQLAETTRTIFADANTAGSLAAIYPTGAAGSLFYSFFAAVINVAYAAAIFAAILNLGVDVINTFVPPRRTHKCISFRKLLEKVCNHLGYQFNSSISDLDKYFFLPSNTNFDEFGNRGFLKKAGTIQEGLPNATDYGYVCSEMFELCLNMFEAKYAIFDDTVEFHAENSFYWEKNSSYILPDTLETSYSYNTNELNSSVFIQFTTDLIDEYTIENYQGTSYQVITDANSIVDEKKKTILGLDRVSLPVCLGSRKNELTGFEKLLRVLAGFLDSALISVFQRPRFVKQINQKVGLLKVSNNYHSVPKVLYLEGGNMPINHRDKLSAKYLWDNYHIYKSFIANNYKKQRQLFKGVKIPFGLLDFLKLIENSYFRTNEGKTGKMERVEWNMAKDFAIVDYYIEEVYTKNLKETYINPS